ncbi:MAG TPA: hypothetical protein VNI57_07970 [Candidatus Saccharimonadales bacterium]|nr:hypothetical protein [Candidatus Saccharimonadales bacterium]
MDRKRRRAALPEGHRLRALARSSHGQCLAALGRRAEAEKELVAGYEGMKRALGEDHDRTRAAATRLAEFYDAWGRPEEAGRYR